MLKEPGAGVVWSSAGVCGGGPGGGDAFHRRHPAGSHQVTGAVSGRYVPYVMKFCLNNKPISCIHVRTWVHIWL